MWMIALVLTPTIAMAVNVRGRADFYTNGAAAPMVRVTVNLCALNGACQSYVTGTDGMYYFTVAPGNYKVVIGGVERLQISVPDAYSFDMPAVQGN